MIDIFPNLNEQLRLRDRKQWLDAQGRSESDVIPEAAITAFNGIKKEYREYVEKPMSDGRMYRIYLPKELTKNV